MALRTDSDHSPDTRTLYILAVYCSIQRETVARIVGRPSSIGDRNQFSIDVGVAVV